MIEEGSGGTAGMGERPERGMGTAIVGAGERERMGVGEGVWIGEGSLAW